MIDEFLRERVAYYLANARVTVSSVKDSEWMCSRGRTIRDDSRSVV